MSTQAAEKWQTENEPETKSSPALALVKGTSNQPGEKQRRDESLGKITLALPFVVASLELLFLSSSAMTFEVLTVLVTAGLISAEAKRFGAGSDSDKNKKGKRREGPTAWFFLTCFLWVFAYPVWFHRRASYGSTKRTTTAIFSVLALLVCTSIAGTRGRQIAPVQQSHSLTWVDKIDPLKLDNSSMEAIVKTRINPLLLADGFTVVATGNKGGWTNRMYGKELKNSSGELAAQYTASIRVTPEGKLEMDMLQSYGPAVPYRINKAIFDEMTESYMDPLVMLFHLDSDADTLSQLDSIVNGYLKTPNQPSHVIAGYEISQNAVGGAVGYELVQQ